MALVKERLKGGVAYRVRISRRDGSKVTSVNIATIVPDPSLSGKELEDFLASEERRLTEEYRKRGETVTFSVGASEENLCREAVNTGVLYVYRCLSEIGLPDYIDSFRERDGAKRAFPAGEMTGQMIAARFLEGASKRRTHAKVLKRMALGGGDYGLDDLYRLLDVIADHMDEVNAYTYKRVKRLLRLDSRVYYYDASNVFFSQSVGEDGIHGMKKSKEGIFAPLVQFGILIDENGLLIGMTVFNGSDSEQPTLRGLLRRVAPYVDVDRVVVCTDAGLCSGRNKGFLDEAERGFITTQPLKGSWVKKYVREWALKDEGFVDQSENPCSIAGLKARYRDALESGDEEEARRLRAVVLTKSRVFNDPITASDPDDGEQAIAVDFEQMLVVTWSLSYYLAQSADLEADLERARSAIERRQSLSGADSKSFRRLIKNVKVTKEGEVADYGMACLDQKKADEERAFFGFYAQSTNLLDEKPSEISRIAHLRWQIEYCFRTMKLHLKARPVYLHTEKHIIGHLELVFLTLQTLKYMQFKLIRASGGKSSPERVPKGNARRSELTAGEVIDAIRGFQGFFETDTKGVEYLRSLTVQTETTKLYQKAFGFSLTLNCMRKDKLLNTTKIRR